MSQWDKLLNRICSLSKDLRFSELQRVLEYYGYKMKSPKGEVVIIRFENQGVCQLLCRSMNQ